MPEPLSLEQIAAFQSNQVSSVLARELIALREMIAAEGGVFMRLNALEDRARYLETSDLVRLKSVEARLDALESPDAEPDAPFLDRAHGDYPTRWCGTQSVHEPHGYFYGAFGAETVDAYQCHGGRTGNPDAEPDACTCGIRPDVPRGPNHGAGCPMEVSAATIAILRGMLADAKQALVDATQPKFEGVSLGCDAEPDAALVAQYRARAEKAEERLDRTERGRRFAIQRVLRLLRQNRTLATERDEARAAVERLRPYARHHDNCPRGLHAMATISTHQGIERHPCTCGLADALKEATDG